MFIIEDERHAELLDGKYSTFDAALAELRRLADISWDQDPNLAPCMSWETCGRHYEIVEYDMSVIPWRQLSRKSVLEVDAKGVRWIEPVE